MGIIKAFKLGFDYLKYDEDGNVEATQRAVNDVNLDIEAGDFVAVLGHNGSGKSTLAKQINALLIPSEGTMWVDDMDTAKEPELWKIRQKAGMVFQNPDNQIIGTVVEEDVGFGPENMGVPTDEIWKHANKVYVMDGGNVVMQGTPREIFSQVETLKKYRLDVPQVTLLAHELHKAGVDIPEGILTKEELVGALCR